MGQQQRQEDLGRLGLGSGWVVSGGGGSHQIEASALGNMPFMGLHQ